MNSSFTRSMLFAALLGAPLVGFGEAVPAPAGGSATVPPTLSPGPTPTAPAGQPTLTIDAGSLTPINVVSGETSHQLNAASDAPPAASPQLGVDAAQEKLRVATEKLKKLMAEREQALQRKRALDTSRASQRAATREKIKQLEAELERLRAQDNALDEELQQRNTAPSSTTPVPADPLRFDFKVSPPDYQPQKGEIRFVPDQKL